MDLQPSEFSNYPRANDRSLAIDTAPPGVYYSYIGEAFKLIFANPLVYIVGTLVSWIISYVGQILFTMILLIPIGLITPRSDAFAATNVFAVIGALVATLLPAILSTQLFFGFSICAIEDKNGGRASFSTLFKGFNNFLSTAVSIVLITFFAYLVVGLLAFTAYLLLGSATYTTTGIEFVLVALVGFLIALPLCCRLVFAPLLCSFDGRGAIDGLKDSWRITKGKASSLGLLLIVSSVVAASGVIGLGVCVLITASVLPIVLGLHYRDYRTLLSSEAR